MLLRMTGFNKSYRSGGMEMGREQWGSVQDNMNSFLHDFFHSLCVCVHAHKFLKGLSSKYIKIHFG